MHNLKSLFITLLFLAITSAPAMSLTRIDRHDKVPFMRAHTTPYLYTGESLQLEQYLLSADGRFVLLLTRAGNLRLYIRETDQVLWETRTAGLGIYEARLNATGSLGLFGLTGYLYWTSGTFGYPNSYLYLQNDGNLVLYYYLTAVWSTNTGGH